MGDDNPDSGPSTDTAPVDLAPVNWTDTAQGFVTESYNALLTLSGVIISVTILSVGASVVLSIIRRAGREGSV